ncbi:MAG: hypothetical protein ACM3O3_12870 [Syntrophothermus sp.]
MFYYKRNYYKLNINNKSYKLVYKIKKYQKESDTLKRILIYEKIISIEQRVKIVHAILNNVYCNGKTLIDYIDFQWNTYTYHKLTTDILNSEYFIILEILSSYLIYENDKKNTDNITHKKLNNYVYSKEVSTFNNNTCFNSSKSYFEISTYTELDLNEYYNTHKRTTKKWKNSKTYKLNNIFSYNKIFNNSYYDWITDTFKTIEHNDAISRKGIIDINIPYISKWCYVDSYNNFEFNNIKYIIDNKCNSYKGSMDYILCFKQNNKYYFFDNNIDIIDNALIAEVKESNVSKN